MTPEQNPYAVPAADAPNDDVATDVKVRLVASETATFGPRFAARLIDSIAGFVAGVGGAVLTSVILLLLINAGRVDREQAKDALTGQPVLLAFAMGAVATTLGHVVSEWIGGASAGKLLLGLRVVDLWGRPISLGAAVKRSVAYVFDSFLLGIPAYNAMSSSLLNQRIGDDWAETVVAHRARLRQPTTMTRAFVGVLLGLSVEVTVITAFLLARL